MNKWKIVLNNGDIGIVEGKKLLKAVKESPFNPRDVKSYELLK